MSKVNKTVEVAVAVLHHQERYLLAYRHKVQHQGERFEFVGGKIEADESAQSALVREVQEEIGLALATEQLTKLGRISHNYSDKQVRLHIYDVAMTEGQYEQFAKVTEGCEGQPLRWVDKSALLAGDYPLPAANLPILTWLKLPSVIAITHELSHFRQDEDLIKAWADYHVQHLPQNSTVYIRPKADAVVLAKGVAETFEPEQQIRQLTLKAVITLLSARADIQVILPEGLGTALDYGQPLSTSASNSNNTAQAVSKINGLASNAEAIESLLAELTKLMATHQVLAQHCTHKTLIEWAGLVEKNELGELKTSNDAAESFLLNELPILVSCHDLVSIEAANKLAAYRIQQGKSVVIGGFLSPIKSTLTHPNSNHLGWSKFSQLSEGMDLPVIALGGISSEDGGQAKQSGGMSVAGIRAFLHQSAHYIS